MDLFSNSIRFDLKVVGWSYSLNMPDDLVIDETFL